MDEYQAGDFAAAWDTVLKKHSLEKVPVSEFIADILAVKDVSEQVICPH